MRLASPTAFLLLAGLLSQPLAARAQQDEPETRAEVLARAREQKQREAEPYEQNAVERGMILAERRIMPLLNRDGIYARMGSLTTGSGFAYGGGYRDRSLVRGRGRLDLWAAASLKRYWALEARGGYPLTSDDRVVLEGHVRRFAAPHEEYFGIGPDAARADQVVYDFRGTTTGTDVSVALDRHVSFGGGVSYLRHETGAADSDSLRSIERVFDLLDAPGLGVPQRMIQTSANLTYDYRQPINARRGGFYRLDLSRYSDRTNGSSSFTRIDLDLRQYVSFLSERRVLAGRAVVTTTDVERGNTIPFFMLPSLGGNDTLRGFRAHRFRGPHALLLQGEYRFEVWSGFDMAIFADAGKVAMRRADIDFQNLEHDIGIGFRFATDNGVVARVDAAFGSRDGKHVHVVFGGLF